MNNNLNNSLKPPVFFLFIFIIWTGILCTIDIGDIGPMKSQVGLSHLNGIVHSFIGFNVYLYTLTDVLSLIPFLAVAFFAGLGLYQWAIRKAIMRVDHDIILLGAYLTLVLLIYIFFEVNVINYRPVLIEGKLEASYPSSTTMLVTSILPPVSILINKRVNNSAWKKKVTIISIVFIIFMVLARILSGVHWISDIIGGLLLSISLVLGFQYYVRILYNQAPIKNSMIISK